MRDHVVAIHKQTVNKDTIGNAQPHCEIEYLHHIYLSRESLHDVLPKEMC